ncbi:MAG: C40 family peptidase [Treponema sp.]|jgi:cell wall-associated NlpC family hydrolase|nr:C40 family peptidase [Treponema sp.]
MKKYVLLCACLCALSGGAVLAAQERVTFTISNDSGETFDELYLAPVESRSWGSDILGGRSLRPKAQQKVTVEKSASGVYDIKVLITAGRGRNRTPAAYYSTLKERSQRGGRRERDPIYSVGAIGKDLSDKDNTNKRERDNRDGDNRGGRDSRQDSDRGQASASGNAASRQTAADLEAQRKAEAEAEAARAAEEQRAAAEAERLAAEEEARRLADAAAMLKAITEAEKVRLAQEEAQAAAQGGASAAAGGLRQAVLTEAEKYIGAAKYESPPNMPNSFDCSGFVRYVYGNATQMSLPSSSSGYASVGTKIDFKDAQPGDLLVFTSTKGGSKIDHVAILYKKSDSGELRGSWVIHAVSIATQSATIKGNSASPGIVVSELGKRADGNYQNEYFFQRFYYARRVLD